MKTRLFYLIVCLTLLAMVSPVFGQTEFPIGTFANNCSTAQISSANFTWLLLPNHRDPATFYNNPQGLKVIAYRAAIYNPSVAQRLWFEADQEVDPDGLKNYFENRLGEVQLNDLNATDGRSWKSTGVGFMVRTPVPDDDYHYGRTSYFANFRLRISKNLSPGQNPDVVKLWVVNGTNNWTRTLKYNDFVDVNYDTFEVRFTLNPAPPPLQSPLFLSAQLTPNQTNHHVDIKVECLSGSVTTWLDYVIVEDQQSKDLFAGGANPILQQISQSADSFNTYSLIRRYYLNDEPFRNGFLPFAKVDSVLNAKDTNRRGLSPIYAYFQRFLNDGKPKDLMVDLLSYQIRHSITVHFRCYG